MFDQSKSAMIHFSLYAYGGGTGRAHPRDLYSLANAEKYMWVPQTIVDGIDVYCEFESTEARDAFLTNPPPEFEKAVVTIPRADDLERYTT